MRPPPRSTLFPYTTLFRSFSHLSPAGREVTLAIIGLVAAVGPAVVGIGRLDRKSTRLNSSHANISYAVFCLKKKNVCHQNVRHRVTGLLGLGPATKGRPPT